MGGQGVIGRLELEAHGEHAVCLVQHLCVGRTRGRVANVHVCGSNWMCVWNVHVCGSNVGSWSNMRGVVWAD